MIRLRFELVGDINTSYPYLNVYFDGAMESFLEIGVTADKELQFALSANAPEAPLTVEEWSLILDKSREFHPRVIANEAAAEKWGHE